MQKIINQTWLEIDLSAIEHNTKVILDAVKVPALAVVKDNGYGHGAVEVAHAFLKAGGTWLAVVRPHEGIDLRKAGIKAPILVFGGALPEEIDSCIENDLTLPLYDFEQADWLSARSATLGKPVNTHIKLDTGMGRFGVFAEQALDLAKYAQSAGGIKIDGIFSHLPLADPGDTLTPKQIVRFKQAVSEVEGAGINLRWKHLANSSGILNVPESYFNLVRAGGVLYGITARRPEAPISMQTRPALSWKARLMSCKQYPDGWGIGYGQDYITKKGDWIGVVPVGHGDNYHRLSGTRVLVGGKSMPVVGVICMDHMMIAMPEKHPLGSEVVIIGKQGDEEITVQELKKIWKSPASNVCLVHPRVPRVYLNG